MQGPAGQGEAAVENQTLESGIKVTNKDRTYLSRARAAAWFRASLAGQHGCVLGASTLQPVLCFPLTPFLLGPTLAPTLQ